MEVLCKYGHTTVSDFFRMTAIRILSPTARNVTFSATLSPLGSIGQRLDTDIVVHCAGEALAAAQILFGRLNRSVPQEKLDLL
jgi:hypothetical protein